MNNFYPTDEELRDFELIRKYCEGELSEQESADFDARRESDTAFAELFAEAEVFFDPAENFLYDITHQEEVNDSRRKFQAFVEQVEQDFNDFLCIEQEESGRCSEQCPFCEHI